MAEQTSLRQFIPEPTTSLMSVEGLSGYTQQNPLPVDERDRQEAARELSRRGITAQAPVPSNQSVMAAPTSINPFNPAFRETARSALNDFFGGSNIAGREGYRTGQLVDNAVGAMDFAPVLGDAMGVGDLRQSIGSRDLIGTAVDTTALAAGMLPILGDAAAKGIKASETSLRSYIDIPTRSDYGPVIQTAEAGRIVETPPRDFRNEKGYSTNPLMAATNLQSRPESIAKGSYRGLVNRYETDPDFAMREQARLLGGRYTQPDNLFMQSATYEDLLGKPLVILPADKTIYGEVGRVAGVDIDPVLVEGGPQHLDRYGNWMSMGGAARSKQAHVNRVREETQQDPILMYTAMANPGSNFSVPPSEIAVNMIKQQGDLTRDQADMLDSSIANLNPNNKDLKGIPESWPGYESPEQLLEWLTTDSPTASAGNKRKAFMGDAILNKPAFQKAGFPIPNDIYSVVNEQEMMNMPKGMSGARAMVSTDINPSEMVVDPTLNRSYNTIIPSQGGMAITEPMVPYDVMYPDPIAARAARHDPYRSFQTSGSAQDYQMANEQWLEGVYQNLKSRGLR